jgi:Tfp pilus assembly protein PilN
MINLLPIDKKAEIRAARTNLILVRYITILILAISFVLASMYVTYSVLGLTKDNSEKIIASNEVRTDIYSSTQSEVDALSASLAKTRSLLDQDVRYSKVFVNIAQLMPPGTVFGKLELNNDSFNGALTNAKVFAKTSADAVTLRQNFEKSALFSRVSFQTIVESGNAIEGYPVSVDMTFTINRTTAQ